MLASTKTWSKGSRLMPDQLTSTGSPAKERFAVTVNLPRSYMGKAELHFRPGTVTLTARSIRHFRTIILSYVVVVLVLIGLSVAIPGVLEFKALLVGVISGVLTGVIYWLLFSSRGDPRSMSLPVSNVSLAKHNGRMLVLKAAFDTEARSGRWTLAAGSRDDAKAIASALTTAGG